MLKTLQLFFLLLFSITAYCQQLVINEIMSSNQSSIFDEDGDNSDWVELFNGSGSVINLTGYYLSDKPDDLMRWAFPDITINPNEFILVFASGKDRAIAGNELHLNFKIDASGEELTLSQNGAIVHVVPEMGLNPNTSFGLQTDGLLPFVVFNDPTPGWSNNGSNPFYDIVCNKEGGIYEKPFLLSLSCNAPNATVFFTTDGTCPSPNSNGYLLPLELNDSFCSKANISQIQISPPDYHDPPNSKFVLKSIVIRAAAFDSLGNRISKILTNSYFIGELGIDHYNLPILSLCAEHSDLFDYETGIFVPGVYWDETNPDRTGNYYQRGDDWEINVNVEFFEGSGNTGFKQTAGLRVHGDMSRKLPQKGMKIYARSEYGISKFDFPVFADKTIPAYKRLVLKPFSSSWSQAGIEDYITNKMAIDTKMDFVATRPVVVYLNGEYWGVYFLQERTDKHYFEANFNIDGDSIDIIGNWYGGIELGSNQDFLALYDFIGQNDLSVSPNYEIVAKWIDIDNFIDYQLFEIFIANNDWPANNMKCWREQKDGAKWRWVYYDGDGALQSLELDGWAHALDNGDSGYPTGARSTLFLRKLLSNQDFSMKLFDRLDFLINNQLSYRASVDIHQHIISEVNYEIYDQIERFRFPDNYATWSDKVFWCNDFLVYRPCELTEQTNKRFNKSLGVNYCYKEKISLSDMFIFPNPNNGNFNLSFISYSSFPSLIKITSLMGQNLLSIDKVILEGLNTVHINVDNLPKGLLFVTVVSELNIFSTKMVNIN